MRLNKTSRAWDLPAAVCLTLIVLLSSYALDRTYWIINLNRVTSLAMFGLLAGYLTGLSSFSMFFFRVFMEGYSAASFMLKFIITLSVNPDGHIRDHLYRE
ncbi:MAG: hypothetical protein FJZ98_04905 [Chloroflexi bacterium]|nr:hypothetical protein [Chloroflexota bacterium]